MNYQQIPHSNISNIITSGDGFACNHIWPMWPHLLQMTTIDTDIISLGKIGAGNEYIFNSVVEQIQKQTPSLVLVQWALSNRFDLIVDTENKKKEIDSDPVYKDHIFNGWWLSSASSINYVTKYHNDYIGQKQHKRRTINYILALQSLLTTMNIPYVFFSSYDLDFLDDELASAIRWDKWIDQQGMESFSRQDRFLDTRLNEVQPSPTVQLEYLLEKLKPQLNLSWNETNIHTLRKLFKNQDWHGLVPHYISRTI